LQELLTRFKNEDPNGNGQADEIPLTDVDMNSTRVWLMAAFGLRTRGIQVDDDVVSYTPTSENYKAFLEYMNTLYDEGLLDKEVYGQSDEQKKAKGENNQLGLFADYFSFFTTGRSEEEAMNDPMFQPVTSEWAPEAKIPGSPRISRGTFALTNVNPSPEASMRWVDYFYSEEGSKYIEQGPDEEPDTRFNDWVAKETAEKMEDIAEVPFPLLYLTIEENDKVAATATDLTTYVEQMEAKFITGVEPLDNWDDYVKTIEAMGIDEYVEVYQAAYDRWKAN